MCHVGIFMYSSFPILFDGAVQNVNNEINIRFIIRLKPMMRNRQITVSKTLAAVELVSNSNALPFITSIDYFILIFNRCYWNQSMNEAGKWSAHEKLIDLTGSQTE